MYVNLCVLCFCLSVYSCMHTKEMCVCSLESGTTGFVTDTFMIEASGEKSSPDVELPCSDLLSWGPAAGSIDD